MRHTVGRLTATALLVLAVPASLVPASLAVSACGPAAGTAEPSASPAVPPPSASDTASAPALPRVTIVRTGGIAGVRQEIEIASDGSWVYTDRRTAKVERGQLTPAQRDQLARMVTDPAFAQEARRSPAPDRCADMFVYAIAVGRLSFGYEPCGDTPRLALTDKVLALVSDATPW
jgi:hypothetical protein